MKNSTKILLISILSFGSYYFFDDLFFKEIRETLFQVLGQLGISHIATYFIVGIPLFVGTIIMHRKSSIGSLGLNKSFPRGLLIPLFFTMPMFVGYAIVFQFNSEINLNEILIGVISAAFFEELYFRGFLFGQIYRYTRIGFIPAIIIGALLFAFGHLYQSQEFSTLVGVFTTTFLGAVLFAWMYAEWKFNLWIPIFLHLFMNLAWLLFSVSNNAFGDTYANIFRIVTIALAISLTVFYKRRNNIPLEINKRTIWMKNKN